MTRAVRLRREARAIIRNQPDYGTPRFRGVCYEAVALLQAADRLDGRVSI